MKNKRENPREQHRQMNKQPKQSARQANRTDGAKESPRVCSACRKNAGAPGAKANTTAASRARTASPPYGAAHRAQKNPSEQAKFAFALLPARRGHVNRGRQKIASLFLAGTIFLASRFYLLRIACSAARSAEQKGAPPPFIPCKLFEKSLSKNFIVWPGGSLTPPRAQQRGAQRRVVPC